MSSLSVINPPRTRRQFSREFKGEMVAQCLKPGASVSRISLDNGLNASMVRRWITETKRAGKAPELRSRFDHSSNHQAGAGSQ